LRFEPVLSVDLWQRGSPAPTDRIRTDAGNVRSDQQDLRADHHDLRSDGQDVRQGSPVPCGLSHPVHLTINCTIDFAGAQESW
jgi:hypothetical protein